MEQDKVILELGEKMVTLTFTPFDADMNIDELVKIDYSNIVGELITFPVAMNRIGILRAELQNELNHIKFDTEVYAAKQAESLRKIHSRPETDTKGNTKIKKPTADEVENLVLLDEGFQLMKRKVFRAQKNFDYVDSLYWAAKDKSDKLNTFSSRISPSEFEKDIVEGQVNKILIKISEKLIK